LLSYLEGSMVEFQEIEFGDRNFPKWRGWLVMADGALRAVLAQSFFSCDACLIIDKRLRWADAPDAPTIEFAHFAESRDYCIAKLAEKPRAPGAKKSSANER